MTKKIDYMALLEARAAGTNVRTVKRSVCLVPDLFDERARAQAEVSVARTSPARYAGNGSEEAEAALKVIEEQIVENSIYVTFNVPDPSTQARYTKQTTDADEDTFPPIAQAALVECFRGATEPDGTPLPITKEQFKGLVMSMWSGELLGIFGALMSASTGEPDFPSSVRR